MSTAVESAPEAQATPPPPKQRWWSRWSLPGCWTALVFGAVAFTPSLLPRSGAVQGLIAGISAAIGYALGVLGAWVWRELADRPPRTPTRRSWRVFLVTAAVVAVLAVVLGQWWQGRIRDVMGMPGEGIASRLLLLVALPIGFALGIGIGRGLHWLAVRATRLLARWIGRRAARTIAWGLVLVASWLVFSGVLLDGLMSAADRAFSLRDGETPPGTEQPTTELRSGGPESLVPWEDLGREGRVFVGGGSDAAEIESVTGRPALEPIRAYVGLAAGGESEDRAELAVADLERAGGFDRSYLLVVTTTGSGWVVPSSADAFEHITGGDSAIVAVQYSYLPSWISYLVDQERAREAGRDLFDAVYARWSARPADDRPELLVFGESLGSFGGETAFSGEADLANRTSGVLFTGPPNFNELYTKFREGREPGSLEITPVYKDGRTIRFDDDVTSGEPPPEDQPWRGTRVLYLVHPSDPIVWWSPRLLLGRPDWLEEPRGYDVPAGMVWIPFVTFWQVSADLLNGVAVPPGHGHNYRGDHVNGWVAILQPAGWTDEDTARVRVAVGAPAGEGAETETESGTASPESDPTADPTDPAGGAVAPDPTPVPPPDGAVPADPLDGRQFLAVEATGHRIVPGTSIELSFVDGRVVGEAGCNVLTVGATWAAGVLEAAGPVASTSKACEPELLAQDAWLSTLLESRPAIVLDGADLVLGDDLNGLILEEEA